MDATWTRKHGRTHYGYKNHIKADVGSKIIQDYEVGMASEHDSQVKDELTSEDQDGGQSLWADSAYRSEEIENMLASKEIKSEVYEKGYKSNPLTKQQIKSNKVKSKTRVRVEHVFGHMTT